MITLTKMFEHKYNEHVQGNPANKAANPTKKINISLLSLP